MKQYLLALVALILVGSSVTLFANPKITNHSNNTVWCAIALDVQSGGGFVIRTKGWYKIPHQGEFGFPRESGGQYYCFNQHGHWGNTGHPLCVDKTKEFDFHQAEKPAACNQVNGEMVPFGVLTGAGVVLHAVN